MIRSFNPIGQGAFYTECFKEFDFNVVYDCGSATDMSVLEKEIKNNFTKGQTIDAVFISHLHDDHINGLDILLSYCNVKKLFLPYLGDESKVLLLLDYYKTRKGNVDTDSYVYKIIGNPESINDGREKDLIEIVYVKEYEELDNMGEPQDIEEVRGVIASGTELYCCRKTWIYKPFNYREKDRSEQLKKAFHDKHIPIPKDANEVRDFWTKKMYREFLIEAYKVDVKGDMNTNSIVVYSGPQYNMQEYSLYHVSVYSFCNKSNMNCCQYYNNKVACLYMGDYDASGVNKWNTLIQTFNGYLDYVGCWQIPHHGSRHNFNPEIANIEECVFVISAGYSNKYRHPHLTVIKDLLAKRVPFFIVDENVGSRLDLLIEIV